MELRTSEVGPPGSCDTQRRGERFDVDFGFAIVRAGAARLWDFATRFGAATRFTLPRGSGLGRFVGVCFATGFATAFAVAAGVGADVTDGAGFAGADAVIGLGGTRELDDVLSGGSGCFRGRPLFRAACPSAINLSNAAFASASSLACCELRALVARSFSARNRSSGLECFISRSVEAAGL